MYLTKNIVICCIINLISFKKSYLYYILYFGYGAPLDFQEAIINSAISSTPFDDFIELNTVGPLSRILLLSLFITSKSAPMYWAISVLFITNKSDCDIPGPPLRGILSPPDTSIT